MTIARFELIFCLRDSFQTSLNHVAPHASLQPTKTCLNHWNVLIFSWLSCSITLVATTNQWNGYLLYDAVVVGYAMSILWSIFFGSNPMILVPPINGRIAAMLLLVFAAYDAQKPDFCCCFAQCLLLTHPPPALAGLYAMCVACELLLKILPSFCWLQSSVCW